MVYKFEINKSKKIVITNFLLKCWLYFFFFFKKIEASAVEIPYTALNEKRERISPCENETRDQKERIEKKKKQKKKNKKKQKKKKKK